ncbi:MAG: hypothetical protein IH589_06725 [Anaerolineales bacterium]|nr:hypothetical protein [Anaerolineales bacterium]
MSMDSGQFGIKPTFGVEISGALAGNVPVPIGLIGTVIQAIAQISSEPVKKVIIHFMEFRAEIRIISDRADRVVKVNKFINIAEVYNKAMFDADKIWFFTDEMKQEYLDTLKQDYTRQFQVLLHSD